MKHWIRIVLVVMLTVAGIGISQWTAQAHAVLEKTDPAADEVLPDPPLAVLLWFSEAVEVRSSRISVEDGSDSRVDRGTPVHASMDERSIRIDLAGVGPGTYSVSWQVMSAVDGHVTYGSFDFHVGEPSMGVAPSPTAHAPTLSESPSVLGIVTRWTNLVAGAVLFAGFAFGLLLRGRNRRMMTGDVAGLDKLGHNLRRPMRAGIVVALVALPVSLILQTASAGSGDLAGIGTILFDTRFGTVWLARIPVLLALGLLLYFGSALLSAWLLWMGLGLASLFILSFSVNSHAAAVAGAGLLPTISDWAHSLASAFWLGGLILLGFGFLRTRVLAHGVPGSAKATRGMPEPGANNALTVLLLPRFSTLAMLSVGVLVATGLYNAWLQLGSPEFLFSTAYGQTLVTKMVISLMALCLGALNSLRVAKLGAPVAGQDVRPLGRSIRAEAGVVLAVFLSVAVLVALPTGREGAGAGDHQMPSTDLTAISATSDAPGNGGRQPSQMPDERSLAGLEALFIGLALVGAAWYKRASLGPPLDGAIIRVLHIVGLRNARAPRAAGLALVSGAGAVLAVIGLYFLLGQLLVDATASKWPRNPVPATAESRALGKNLYAQMCLDCHGPEGGGDGPRAGEFEADMDLSSHVLAHPSGLIYFWISDGMENGMPAYADQLVEEERWHLVNYIRTFGQSSLFEGHAH